MGVKKPHRCVYCGQPWNGTTQCYGPNPNSRKVYRFCSPEHHRLWVDGATGDGPQSLKDLLRF